MGHFGGKCLGSGSAAEFDAGGGEKRLREDMGQSGSSEEVALTAAQTVEQNNLELLTFLFLLLLTLVSLAMLSIAIIYVFFPSLTKHNGNCFDVTSASMPTATNAAAAAKTQAQGSFNTLSSWLSRIRITSPMKRPLPQKP